MILCLDTNTVVQALAQHHPFHPILDAWVAGHLTWAVSTPILLEYEEVLTLNRAGRFATAGQSPPGSGRRPG
jgi:predicted nucleic acid-binding protein